MAKPIKTKKNKKPKIGDKIYIDTSLYLSHGIDDFIGGICTISKVGKTLYDDCYIEIEENPGPHYYYENLMSKQEDLKKKFGSQKGHREPDTRPEYNMND